MRILKSLNKKYLSIIFFSLISIHSYSEDKPVDIWNIDKEKIEKKSTSESISSLEDDNNQTETSDIFKMQSQKDNSLINIDNVNNSEEIKIIGLYDPEDYDLNINMWSNSDGDQLKVLFKRLNNMKLSNDAIELINISLLTNAHLPQRNISEKEFLSYKSNWLIKNSNLNLIEEYLTQNQAINLHPKLTKFIVDQYLSNTNIDKACKIFSKNKEPIIDEYLSKFNIYCLIINDKKEEAQLILDLKKELGFKDIYYEKKINFLLGYTNKVDDLISEESILNFYLAHQTN